MKKSESIAELAKALAQFQNKVKQPLKDKDNPFFKSKYVPLESVVESITEVAPEFGLSFVQWALNDESGRTGIATMLMHESGEFIEFDPIFANADKNNAQGTGSLITYLKRYSLSAIFGITSDEDDDGNAASTNNNNNQKYQQNTPTPKKASDKQVGALKAALKELIGLSKEGTTEKVIMDTFKIPPFNELTVQTASRAINDINAVIEQRKAKVS